MREDQFEYRKGRETREAILCLRLLLEKRLKKGLGTHVAFIDLEKAFDNVEWSKMFQTLKEVGLQSKERRVIMELIYKDKKAEIQVG